MDKNDRDEIAESGQISEHSDYIAESTLLPETESSIPETETIDNSIGDGLPGGSAHGVKASKAKKSFLKENAPFLVFGAIVLVVGGAFGYKKLTQPSADIAQTVATSVPVLVEQAPLPAALPPELPVLSEGALSDVIPGANDSGVVSVPDASIVSQAAPQLEVKSDAGMTSSSDISTPQPASPISKAVVPEKPQALVSQNSDASLAAKLAISEKKLEDAERELQNLKQNAKLGAKTVSCDVATVKKSSTRKSAQKSAANSKKKPAVKNKSEKQLPIEEAAGMNIRAIKNGLAWVQLESGKVVTVREGDSLPDLGKVKKIDGRTMQVFAGSKRIEQK